MTAFKFGPSNSRYFGNVPAFFYSEGTPGADSLTVEPSGYLISLLSDAVQLTSAGAWTLSIQGAVMSKNGAGVITTPGTSTLSVSVGAEGFISASTVGIYSQVSGPATITNAGTIVGESQGIITSGKATITNTGKIQGSAFAISNTDGGATINNKGTIQGALDLDDDSKSSITNSGSIFNNIEFGTGDDTLTNSGTIVGDIDFGSGNNRLTNPGTLFSGHYIFSSGNDTVTNSNFVNGELSLGSGNNVVKNSGTISGNVISGLGNDSFTNSGTKSIVGGYLSMGDGKNTVSNGGHIKGDIFFSGGDDSVTNVGSQSRIDGFILFSEGANKLTNAGTVNGSISAGSGVDTIINSGTITSLDTGSGNDKITNSGSIIGTLNLGDGDDKYTGGASSDSVPDSNGSETIALGAGNDVYFAVGAAASKDGLDRIDGGAGIDRYDAAGAPGGLKINLDTVDHEESFVSAGLTAKNSASLKVGSPIFTGDNVVGFENAMGGSDDDWIYGNASSNGLNGSGGNDFLAGYAGNDVLTGGTGTGTDSLFGGAGADRLFGDLGNDFFFYTALTDSGVGLAKRDLIQDFTDGQDTILIGFDGNTKIAGVQSFDYLNEDQAGTGNVNFTGQAGQLRTIWTLDGYLIEGDVNGDAKPDFQIEVLNPNHDISWSSGLSGDFLILS